MESSYEEATGDRIPHPHPVGRALAIVGAFLQLGILLAIASPLLAPQTRGELDFPPHAWMLFLVYGLFAASIGVILLLISLLGTRYREPWFFWVLVIEGVVLSALVFIIPLGEIVTAVLVPSGPIFLIYCLVRKRDFFSRSRLRYAS